MVEGLNPRGATVASTRQLWPCVCASVLLCCSLSYWVSPHTHTLTHTCTRFPLSYIIICQEFNVWCSTGLCPDITAHAACYSTRAHCWEPLTCVKLFLGHVRFHTRAYAGLRFLCRARRAALWGKTWHVCHVWGYVCALLLLQNGKLIRSQCRTGLDRTGVYMFQQVAVHVHQ